MAPTHHVAAFASNGLRIGLVHWSMPPTTGGVESHVADLAVSLTELGCAVTVMTGERAATALSGVEIVYLPFLDIDLIRGDFAGDQDSASACAQALGEVISSRRLEVVHGHNLHHFLAAPALALDELRSRLGFRLHHTFHETWPDILSERSVYREWDGNYAVSSFVRDECAKHIGFRPHVRTLGVDVDRFKERRLSMMGHAEPVILHPARLLPWKGVHVSIDMLAALHQQGLAARLIITDTQRIIDWNAELVSYREHVLALVRVHGLADKVEFRGVPYARMPELYDEADIVVYPTVGDEPYGLVPLEAMSMARPVAGSRSGGIVETIVDGETGYLVERGDAKTLAERVATLLTDPERCRRMGQAGRRRAVANFNGRLYAASLLDSYLSDHAAAQHTSASPR
jgi:glycosyltransferase involved in cell wall biosynthesis